MDVIETLKSRRSIRRFATTPVPKEVLEEIIDCARLAPTARNEQPWEFVVVTDPNTRGQIAAMTDFGSFIAEAPACIVVFCRDCKYYLEDGSAAVTTILLAAKGLGLASCWVAGDKKDYADGVRELLGAPAQLRLIALIPLGYSDDAPNPRKRPLGEVLHWEGYQGSS
ncbi:MAG: nitroreductase family protein [Limnochordia bacterium]